MANRARIDKYDPISGGFRAPLDFALDAASVGTPIAVSLNANGRIVRGTAGNSGFAGILVASKPENIGQVMDVMTDGEIVDAEGLVAGTKYRAAADGTLNTTGTNPLAGWTVEADRLVVRVARV